MKKIIGAFMGVSLLFVGISAKGAQLDRALNTAVSTAVQKATAPKVSIYGLDNIFSSPEYMAFLKERTLEIIGNEDGVSLDKLKQNGLGGVQWSGLSAQEQESIERLADRKGYLEESRVMQALVLLDAKLKANPKTKKSALHMDAQFASDKHSGLTEVDPYAPELGDFRVGLYNRTRARAREQAKRQQRAEQALENFSQESQKIKWIDENGTINREELDKLHDLCMSTYKKAGGGKDTTPEKLFEKVVKDHLVSKESTRGGGVTYIFDDGTRLYHNYLRREHRYL